MKEEFIAFMTGFFIGMMLVLALLVKDFQNQQIEFKDNMSLCPQELPQNIEDMTIPENLIEIL